MTITTNPPTAPVDDEGKQIEPGTLCFIRTEDEAPPGWQNKRSLAVWAGGHGQQRWMMLIPDDGIRGIDQVGWRIGNQVTAPIIERLNLRRFMSSHRGWWLGQAQFLETCTGHWCIEHQVFHATETCPPSDDAPWIRGEGVPIPPEAVPVSDEPDRFVENARIAQLERDLATARAETIAAVKAHEDFIVKASDILGEEADSHDLCEVYDSIARDAGLLPRMGNQDVEVEVTYRQTVTVRARTWEAAVEIVKGKGATNYFSPPTPFAETSSVEDMGLPYSLAIEVVTD